MTTQSDAQSTSDSIGIYAEQHKLYGCRTARTIFGSLRHRHAEVQIVDGDLEAGLRSMIELLDGDATIPVAVSIPTDECYFATRPVTAGGAKASPRVLLRESLRSSTTSLDQFSIDVINWQPDRRPVAGIVAVSSDRVDSIREAMENSTCSLYRLAPAATSLLIQSADDDSVNGLVTRVFLGNCHMLAVMCRGANPIHWQEFELPSGDEATGIVSSIRALETAAAACGLERVPDTVVIHGRLELETLIDHEWLTENLQNDMTWVPSPTLQPAEIAQAAANQLFCEDNDAFDLVRQHRAPIQLRRVVPYKEIAMYCLLVVCLGGFLWMKLAELKNKRTSLVVNAPRVLVDGKDPKPEKDRLSARASAVSQFLDKRVLWSGIIDNVSSELPDGIRLSGINGTARMAQRRKKQVRENPSTMVLEAECALDDDGNIPKSLNTLADSIKSLPAVQKSFKRVELSGVRRVESQDTGVQGAQFSIVLTNDAKGAK